MRNCKLCGAHKVNEPYFNVFVNELCRHTAMFLCLGGLGGLELWILKWALGWLVWECGWAAKGDANI